MIPLLLVGLTVLVLASMVKGDRREARGASPVVPPPPPRPGSTVVVRPEPASDMDERPGATLVPGLLLRREPEIRALPTEALRDYVGAIDAFIAGGGVPTVATWTSRTQAAAETLLRSRTRQSTTSLTDEQLSSLLSWLLQLEERGMAVDTDERALRLNVEDEMERRQGR